MSCKNEKQTVKVLRIHPDAKLPAYASVGAAAADVTTISDWSIAINPGCSQLFRTGLKFEIPVGWEIKVHSRSGHGFKHGIRLSNCTGILDSDYTGELMVKLTNDSETVYMVQPFERICQIQVCRAMQHDFVETLGELKVTERGEAGFGSTGTTELGSHNHSLGVNAFIKNM